MAGVAREAGARAALAIAVVAGVALAAAASPAEARERVRFAVQDWSKGAYDLDISATSSPRSRLHFTVGREYTRNGSGVARYSSMSPRVRRSGIKAKLGELGSISMRFQAHRQSGTRCKRARGVLEGRFRFRGEDGYLRVAKRRLRATRTIFRTGSCKPRVFRAGAERATRRSVMLEACTERTALFAGKVAGGVSLIGAAQTGELAHGLRLYRAALVFPARGSFTHNRDLSRATVSPSAPFSGTGRFSPGTLSGDLRFKAPGARRIALTPAEAYLYEDGHEGESPEPMCELLARHAQPHLSR